MNKSTSLIQQAGLAVGLATFLISNAQATPFQAEPLKTGYENAALQKTSAPVAPNEYPGATAEDVSPGTTSANTPEAKEPPVASDKDPFSEPANTTNSDKATDGKCGMSGTGSK